MVADDLKDKDPAAVPATTKQKRPSSKKMRKKIPKAAPSPSVNEAPTMMSTPSNSFAAPGQGRGHNVVIVGTGDHAYGLSHLFKINNPDGAGNVLEVTKPTITDVKGQEEFHTTGVYLAGFADALLRADIVVLAIPSSALGSFVKIHAADLEGKILVDATNSKSGGGDDLYSVLANMGRYSPSLFRWVKAFNDFGAADVLLKKANKVKLPTKMCSPDDEALEQVKDFAETSMGMVVKKVPFDQYTVLAKHQASTGKEWSKATWIMIATFIVTQIYNIIR